MGSVQDGRSLMDRCGECFSMLQGSICAALEEADGAGRFSSEPWTHATGGGGVTRVLQGGGVFEKAGVNVSAVRVPVSGVLAPRLGVECRSLRASGISLVLHPASPMVPAVHMNLRYLEPENGKAWFGGGADLTPYYLFEEDAGHFHGVLKSACEKRFPGIYPELKAACDEYFTLRHRAETRGVGGIFFDNRDENPESWFSLVRDLGPAFLEAYLPIVRRRRTEEWGNREKEWQLIRRGRYVEFNLIQDRGTLFGLETQGRVESILVSLPPEARWSYGAAPPRPASREALLLDVLKRPRSWA